MMPKQERDEWLMAQVALGKRDYLEPLIRRYASPLLTFIQQMVRDRHRSEELFQEVFLAVWTKRRQYQFPRTFKSWLYAIAVNKCRAAFRGRSLPGSLSLSASAAAGYVERHCDTCRICQVALEEARRRFAAFETIPPTEASQPLIQATLDRIDRYERGWPRLRRRLILGVALPFAAAVLILAL